MYFGFRKPIQRVRTLGVWEGWSFLILLGLAMPLKYIAGYPMAVTIVGAIHGFLFLAYWLVIFEAAVIYGWTKSVVAALLFSAVFPFGPFLAEKWLLVDIAKMIESQPPHPPA